MKLTNEEIRIKVAESLGYERRPCEWQNFIAWHDPSGKYLPPIEHVKHSDRQASHVPNYPESLDACAEFEAHAYRNEPSGWLARYEDELRERCSMLQYPHYNPICATALHRCLAYLKTKNLIP